jgi:hypothetical protein
MRSIVTAVILSLTVATAAAALSAPAIALAAKPSASKPAAPPASLDKAKVATHLKNHVDYPADKKTVLAACASTEEFTKEEKAWFASALPAGTYKNADDVLKAVGL